MRMKKLFHLLLQRLEQLLLLGLPKLAYQYVVLKHTASVYEYILGPVA